MNRYTQPNTEAPLGAKKSLGQHWLTSKGAVQAIVTASKVQKGDVVLEIGPGKGILTEALLASGALVFAVEKDYRMIPHLQEKFSAEIEGAQLTLIEGDALEIAPPTGTYSLVANIPYYITGAILKNFLEHEHQPTSMTLLVQKEVAERIARSKKESILSLSVKAFGDPKYIQTIKAGSFSPPPKVDSAILHISDISRSNFSSKKIEKQFFTLVKSGFSAKRKKLAGNLKQVLTEPAAVLAAAGIDVNIRAEDVPLQKWLILSDSSTN